MSDDTIQRYEKMLAEDPQSRAFAPLAEAHRKAGRLDEAIKIAKAGLEVHPGYSGGLVVLGRALYEKGEIDNAAEVLQKAVSETPESYLGQKFLGKILMDKGDSPGAMRALEAANLLSPEDEEVARLLDEVKSKAVPPETMEYREREAEAAEKAQIVTYEQKPTTIDGVELPPLPSGGSEETFSFSGGGTVDPADITPVDVEEAPPPVPGTGEMTVEEVAEEDMTATVIEEEEVEQAMGIESLDELGPEAAAFIMEGEAVAEDAGEQLMDEIPGAAGEAPGPPTGQPSKTPAAGQPAAPVAEAARQAQVQPTAETAAQPASAQAEASAVAQEAMADRPADMENMGDVAKDRPAPEPPSGHQPLPEAARAPEPGPQAAPPPEPGPTVQSPASGGIEGTDARGLTEEPAPSVPPGPQPAPPGAEQPPSESAGEEQFSTETLADLYAQQGLTDKALGIYRQILQQDPGNEAVRLKMSALESQPEADQGPTPVQAQPPPAEAPTQAPRVDDAEDTLNALESLLENVERIKRP